MKKFLVNRLVRDKVVPAMVADGGKPNFKVLSNKEFVNQLCQKLLEEAKEITPEASPETILEELADLQEIIDSLLVALNFDKRELQATQNAKNNFRGSFNQKHFVKSIEVDDDYPWLDYYLKNPDKFKEIRDGV